MQARLQFLGILAEIIQLLLDRHQFLIEQAAQCLHHGNIAAGVQGKAVIQQGQVVPVRYGQGEDLLQVLYRARLAQHGMKAGAEQGALIIGIDLGAARDGGTASRKGVRLTA